MKLILDETYARIAHLTWNELAYEYEKLEAENKRWDIFKEQVLMYRDMTIGGLSNDAQWIVERINDALLTEKETP